MSDAITPRPNPDNAQMLTSPWYSFSQKFQALEIYGRPAPYPVVNERLFLCPGSRLVRAKIDVSNDDVSDKSSAVWLPTRGASLVSYEPLPPHHLLSPVTQVLEVLRY